MNCKRGDVILIRYPNSDLKGFKKRPATDADSESVEPAKKEAHAG